MNDEDRIRTLHNPDYPIRNVVSRYVKSEYEMIWEIVNFNFDADMWDMLTNETKD